MPQSAASSGSPTARGGARAGDGAGIVVGRPRYRRTRSITAACSISAIKRRRPPQRGQATTSTPKVRRISAAQHWPRARRRAASAGSSGLTRSPGLPAATASPTPRGADVPPRTISARHAARGPRTPWYSTRLIRGRGTITASRLRNPTGANTRCVVPSAHRCRTGTFPSPVLLSRSPGTEGRRA